MMEPYYEMDAPAVHTAGHQVAGLTEGAHGLAVRYIGSIDETGTAVHHPTVKSALDRYRETWHGSVNATALEIDALGNNTGSSAVTVAATDEDSSHLLTTRTAATDAQGGYLSRPINGSTVV